MHHFALVALLASLATATLLNRDVSDVCKKHPSDPGCESEYLATVCSPNGNNADIDLNAPCNIFNYIGMECVYGQKIQIDKDGLVTPRGQTQSNSTQRLCICESAYFDAAQGCEDCRKAHGGEPDTHSSVITSLSSAYCAATFTPTNGIYEFQASYVNKPQFSSLFSSNSASATSTFSDPIGNKTDASLYWTAPISGTAILDIGAFTETAKPTTTNISNGQIVATAAATQAVTTGQTTASPGASTTTTSGIAARQTEAVFAGVLGLVGMVAML